MKSVNIPIQVIKMHDHVTNQFHSFVEYWEKLYIIIILYCVGKLWIYYTKIGIIKYSFSTYLSCLPCYSYNHFSSAQCYIKLSIRIINKYRHIITVTDEENIRPKYCQYRYYLFIHPLSKSSSLYQCRYCTSFHVQQSIAFQAGRATWRAN